jgi:hypothetical protein
MNEQFHAYPVDRETARAAYPLVYLRSGPGGAVIPLRR